MPRTMRAYRLVAWERPPELVEVPVPTPGPGQVVVQVAGCGLCHSDLDMMAMPAAMGEALGWSMPFTLGHETAGWVAAVGTGVDGVAEGDAVAVSSPSSCGRCRWCLAGRDNACPHGLVGRGYGRDGGLADAVLVDDVRSVLPLAPGLDPTAAGPLTDAAATSHHAVRRVLPRVRPDGTVVVIGVGGLGAFVVQILRATTTARVVAVDPDPVRREVAVGLGAHHVVDGVGPGTARAVAALVGEGGADAVIDLVGSDATIACATRVCGPGGAIAVVGAAGGTLARPWFGSLPRDGEVFTFQGSDLADARAVLDLAASGAIEVPLVPFALEDAAAAYDALRGGGLAGRVLVRP
ncbi:MAG: alcohol dehydrogenase catalytic domain-containing protein [Acidimicrobiales bacterium]